MSSIVYDQSLGGFKEPFLVKILIKVKSGIAHISMLESIEARSKQV
jgi:hypothetical protein